MTSPGKKRAAGVGVADAQFNFLMEANMNNDPDHDLSSFLVDAEESTIGGLRCRKFLAPIEVRWTGTGRDWWEIFSDDPTSADLIEDNIDPTLLLLGVIGWKAHVGHGLEFVCQDTNGRIGTAYRNEVQLV